LLTVILNLIQNLLKNDPDFHQDDDEKGILDPVPFDTGLEQARMTREINCYIVKLLHCYIVKSQKLKVKSKETKRRKHCYIAKLLHCYQEKLKESIRRLADRMTEITNI